MKILPHENDPRARCALGGPGSVSVLGGVVLWRHDQPTALAGPPVHRLDDVDHLLLVLHGPVDLVVVASAQIDHDVLVPVRGKGSVLTRIPLKKNHTENMPYIPTSITGSCQTLAHSRGSTMVQKKTRNHINTVKKDTCSFCVLCNSLGQITYRAIKG